MCHHPRKFCCFCSIFYCCFVYLVIVVRILVLDSKVDVVVSTDVGVIIFGPRSLTLMSSLNWVSNSWVIIVVVYVFVVVIDDGVAIIGSVIDEMLLVLFFLLVVVVGLLLFMSLLSIPETYLSSQNRLVALGFDDTTRRTLKWQ